jgi:hypothetical protein
MAILDFIDKLDDIIYELVNGLKNHIVTRLKPLRKSP